MAVYRRGVWEKNADRLGNSVFLLNCPFLYGKMKIL
jgi:hypothetical protein